MEHTNKIARLRKRKQSSRSAASEAADRAKIDPRATWRSLALRSLLPKKPVCTETETDQTSH